MLFPHVVAFSSGHVVASVSIHFLSNPKGMFRFKAVFEYCHANWDIFLIICKTFQGRVFRFGVSAPAIRSFIINIRSNLIHHNGFQLLVLSLIEIISFIFTNKINLLSPKPV